MSYLCSPPAHSSHRHKDNDQASRIRGTAQSIQTLALLCFCTIILARCWGTSGGAPVSSGRQLLDYESRVSLLFIYGIRHMVRDAAPLHITLT